MAFSNVQRHKNSTSCIICSFALGNSHHLKPISCLKEGIWSTFLLLMLSGKCTSLKDIAKKTVSMIWAWMVKAIHACKAGCNSANMQDYIFYNIIPDGKCIALNVPLHCIALNVHFLHFSAMDKSSLSMESVNQTPTNNHPSDDF